MTNNKPNDVRVVSVQLLEHIESALRVPDGCPPEIWKEVERTVNGYRAELRAILAQPTDKQDEPVAWLDEDSGALATAKLKTCMEDGFEIPLYRHAQPATAKVVLPERLDMPHRDEFESADQHAAAVGEAKTWNACLDEVAKLNGGSQ